MSRRLQLMLLITLLMGVGLVGWVAAQSGTRRMPATGGRRESTPSKRATTGSAPRDETLFEDRLWRYLQDSRYRNWGPMPGQSDDAYAANSPHGDLVKLYVNRLAAGRPTELPVGSILVKENYDSTGNVLIAITVMYRSKGFAPEAGDWNWTKYEPDGTVSRMKDTRLAGKIKMCIECHQSAMGGDYVFANDRQ